MKWLQNARLLSNYADISPFLAANWIRAIVKGLAVQQSRAERSEAPALGTGTPARAAGEATHYTQ